MWEALAALPGKILGWLPESWRTGVAKGLVLLTISVLLVAGFAVAVAGIMIGLEVGLLGRGITFSWLAIPDRKIENCKVLSPHLTNMEATVSANQAEYNYLENKLNQFQTNFIETYKANQEQHAVQAIQPIINDTKKEIADHRNKLKESIDGLTKETDKLLESCNG